VKSKCLVIILSALLSGSSADAIGLRLGGGAEVIPLTYVDLKDYNTGTGYGLRSDIVWGRSSATTVEMGYRRWDMESPLGKARLEFHRIGLLQRFYPLSLKRSVASPYVGVGITAIFHDNFSLNIPDADMHGITLLVGCEIPAYINRVSVDPFVRYELNRETDWTYSYVCVGANLIWKLF